MKAQSVATGAREHLRDLAARDRADAYDDTKDREVLRCLLVGGRPAIMRALI